MSMPLDEFTNLVLSSYTCHDSQYAGCLFRHLAFLLLTLMQQQASDGVAKGEEQVPVGYAVKPLFEQAWQEHLGQLAKAMSKQ